MMDGEKRLIRSPGKRSLLIKDYSGFRQGMLTFVRPSRSDGRRTLWLIRCDCGTEVEWPASTVAKGNKSCGCAKNTLIGQANRRHGMTKHPAYAVWRSMRQRCESPTHPAWRNYGGRGIAVCAAWAEAFENFWADMGPTWAPGLDLDRADNSGSYTPENCRWVSRRVNARNKRNRLVIGTPEGPMQLAEAAERSGLGVTTLHYRHANGWPPERMFDRPDVRNRCTTSSIPDRTTDSPS